jgi:hypothetical protein
LWYDIKRIWLEIRNVERGAYLITHEITVKVSSAVYQEVSQKAAQSKRSVEAQASLMLESVTKSSKKLPNELEYLLMQMHKYDTKRLWRIARGKYQSVL